MTSFFPTDPLALDQWHLLRLGNIQRIWGEYTGLGISVGVYDTGVQFTHPDLAGNYDASRHVVVNGVTFSGDPVEDWGHGTSVAGLIAAQANGIGTVGVAFGARITGVNVFDDFSDLYLNADEPVGFYEAVAQSTRFDVVNHSWNSDTNFRPFDNSNIAGGFTEQMIALWAVAAAEGRNGLGTIVVQSAGNEEREAQASGMNASRYTITVAAVSDTGFAASYSNHGASILVAAPGGDFASVGGMGIVATDLLGMEGSNLRSDFAAESDHTDDFDGTSAAAPIVSGAVALMLEANPGLGWRDVQNILAASATHTGSSFTATTAESPHENGIWRFNKADNWNGGGMHFHENYGYGHLNVYNAVRMAEVWTLFAPAQTSANERWVTTGIITPNWDLPDHTITNGSLSLTRALEIEHVSISISLTHQNFRDLEIYLTSAEGTEVRLLDRSAGFFNAAEAGLAWTFGIETLRGERSDGTWILSIRDMSPGFSGTFHAVALTVYGRAAQVNDVYHFTDEFAALSTLQNGRRVISDTDGGTDWINAAAVSTASVINLNENAYSSIGGGSLRITGVIENAIGGDGDDVLIGNAAANELRGMRGADTMRGGLGNDSYFVDHAGDVTVELAGGGNDRVEASLSWTLAANIERLTLTGTGDINGTGNALANRVDGNDGANLLDGAGGNDSLHGLAGDDTLLGGAGADRLDGGAGADSMAGGADNDTYMVDDALDLVFELAGGGNDRVMASVSHTLAAEVERLILTGSADLEGTGNELANQMEGNAGDNRLDGGGGHDSLSGLDGDDTLLGGAGADRLDGGAGADSMVGGTGNDSYIVDDALDVVVELPDEGNDRVFSSVSHTLGTGVERLTLTGSAALDGTGNALANRMEGNAGGNRLDGADGHDSLSGFDGDDTLLGGAGADRLEGGLGADSLVGGLGADRFVFLSAAEADGDSIGDFSAAQGDRIDLNAIDSNLLLAGDQVFVWIGGAGFAGLAGQLRFADEILEGDLDGDAVGDFQIGLAGLVSLSATSIWL